MSRMEPDQDLRERYAAMEDRLSVRNHFCAVAAQSQGCLCFSLLNAFILLQVVRKRLNRPMTLAEKVNVYSFCACLSL